MNFQYIAALRLECGGREARRRAKCQGHFSDEFLAGPILQIPMIPPSFVRGFLEV